MTKKSLKEEKSTIIQAVSAIFNAVATKKMNALKKTMMNDPEFKDSVSRLEKLRDELEKHFQKTIATQPGYQDSDEWYTKNIEPLSK